MAILTPPWPTALCVYIPPDRGKIWRELQTSEGMRLAAFGFLEEDAEHSAVICINAVKLLLLKVAVLRNYSTSLKVICCKMKTLKF